MGRRREAIRQGAQLLWLSAPHSRSPWFWHAKRALLSCSACCQPIHKITPRRPALAHRIPRIRSRTTLSGALSTRQAPALQDARMCGLCTGGLCTWGLCTWARTSGHAWSAHDLPRRAHYRRSSRCCDLRGVVATHTFADPCCVLPHPHFQTPRLLRRVPGGNAPAGDVGLCPVRGPRWWVRLRWPTEA